MPIHDMLYRCPRCGHDPLDGHKGGAKCFSCGTSFEQGRGSVITVRPPKGPPEQSSATSLIADMEKMGEGLFREARVALGMAEGHDVIRWRGEVLGFSERISWKGEGLIRLEGEALTFTPVQDTVGLVERSGRAGLGDTAEGFSCLLGDIRGVQISSKALQVTLEERRLYQFEFIDDSPKRWEDLLCLALTRLYTQSGRSIIEFKPRLVTEPLPMRSGR
jgi:hypothetical protein